MTVSSGVGSQLTERQALAALDMLKAISVTFAFLVSFCDRAYGECEPQVIPKELETFSVERVLLDGYWVAFKDTNPRQCWAVAIPIKSSVAPKGAEEDLCRGSTSLAVHFVPERSTFGEIVFKSGYEFSEEFPVKFEMDKKIILEHMLMDGQYAWTHTRKQDGKVRAQMLKAREIVIQGTAKNGALVEDIFNLEGFEATYEAAYRECTDLYSYGGRVLAALGQ
jgi:hypothetical protein